MQSRRKYFLQVEFLETLTFSCLCLIWIRGKPDQIIHPDETALDILGWMAQPMCSITHSLDGQRVYAVILLQFRVVVVESRIRGESQLFFIYSKWMTAEEDNFTQFIEMFQLTPTWTDVCHCLCSTFKWLSRWSAASKILLRRERGYHRSRCRVQHFLKAKF